MEERTRLLTQAVDHLEEAVHCVAQSGRDPVDLDRFWFAAEALRERIVRWQAAEDGAGHALPLSERGGNRSKWTPDLDR